MSTPHSATPFRSRYNGTDPETLKTAEKLTARGLDWLYYESRSKNPNTRSKGWQTLASPSLDEAERVFRSGAHSIGVHLRNGLADTDIDTIEAVRIARRMEQTGRLPRTGMMWGRASKPRSHYLYLLNGALAKGTSSWQDPTPAPQYAKAKSKLVELRVKGQTVAPGSVHDATGELVCFEPDGDGVPSIVEIDELIRACKWLAAAALVARYWRDGDRHDTALPLAGFLWHGGMSEANAVLFVEDVCAGAKDEDVANRVGCVRDTYRNGAAGLHIVGGPTLVLGDCLTEAQVRKVREWLDLRTDQQRVGILGPDGLPLSGDGDGDRFAALWAGHALYCAKEDRWYLWDGAVFRPDDVKHIREMAKEVAFKFRADLGGHQERCGRDGVASYAQCADYAKRLGDPGMLNNMLTSAQSKPEFRVVPDDLNANPDMLTTLDVTLTFNRETGEVTSHLHDPADRITWLAPVRFQPNATHPLFTQYLRRFYPERERRRFLQEIAGYMLLGGPKRHAIQLIGPHDSGKTTTLALFRAMLGDYAATLASTSLLRNPHKGGDVGRPDLWRVKRKRLVTVAEVDPEGRLDVELFKTMTGGDDAYNIRTFFDVGGGEDVFFHFLLLMSGNKPYGPPPDETEAFDRLGVLKCEHVVPGDTRKGQEERDLTHSPDVLSAAFAWAVRGFERLYGRKDAKGVLLAPASSVHAKGELREALDIWGVVFDQIAEVTDEPDAGVTRAGLWRAAIDALERDGEDTRHPRKLQKLFEESVRWRVGSNFTHSSAKFGGVDYWPRLKLRGAGRGAVGAGSYGISVY